MGGREGKSIISNKNKNSSPVDHGDHEVQVDGRDHKDHKAQVNGMQEDKVSGDKGDIHNEATGHSGI